MVCVGIGSTPVASFGLALRRFQILWYGRPHPNYRTPGNEDRPALHLDQLVDQAGGRRAGAGDQRGADAVAVHRRRGQRRDGVLVEVARDRARLQSEMETLLQEALMDRFLERTSQQQYGELIEKVLNRNISPQEAVKFLVNGNPK